MEATVDNTIIIIPSYNEARTIADVVKGASDMGFTVLVVDDGSVDDTERVALDSGAMVIRSKHNLGKGSAVRQGISYVLDKTSFEWVMIMDGDGQHHTEDIPALIGGTSGGRVDVVIGNRMQETSTMPVIRYWTNRFMSWMVSRMCGQYIPDTQCGYRLISVEALRRFELSSDKYDIESEMLIVAAQENMGVVSVPIRTIYGNEVSKIDPVRDTIRFFSLVFKHYVHKKGRGGK